MKKRLSLFALLLFSSILSHSQDLMCGTIFYHRISGYAYQINGVIVAQTSTAIPRTYFLVSYGDDVYYDSIPVLPPVDSSGNLIYHFSTVHTYPGPGTYFIDVESDFLIDSVVNLPNAVHEPLILTAELTINPFGTADDSPVFTQPPLSIGQQGLPFLYNPGVYDPNGDSLSYSLIPVDSDYSFAGVTIDSITGDIKIADAPGGRYLFKIKVSQWGNINTVEVNTGYVESQVFFYFANANGIDEVMSEEKLKLYPNPVTSQLTIHTSSIYASELATVSIMNVLGQETLPQRPLNVEKGDAVVDVSNLASGIYFVQVVSESGRWVGKFIKE